MKSAALPLSARIQALSMPLRTWMLARSPRERSALLAAAVILLLGGAATIIDGVLTTRERLERQLPALRAELRRMQDDATELARLQAATPPPARSTGDLVTPAIAAARATGLELDIRADETGLSASGPADIAPLIEWLATMQADHRLYVTQLRHADGGVEAVLSPGPER